MDDLKSDYGYPKIVLYFRISIIESIKDILKSKENYIKEIRKLFKNEFRISLNRIMVISLFMNILNLKYGYPEFKTIFRYP